MKKVYISPIMRTIPMELGTSLHLTVGSTTNLPVHSSGSGQDAANAYAQEMMMSEEGADVEDLW